MHEEYILLAASLDQLSEEEKTCDAPFRSNRTLKLFYFPVRQVSSEHKQNDVLQFVQPCRTHVHGHLCSYSYYFPL